MKEQDKITKLKKCSKCNISKNYICFSKNKGNKDGYQSRCKTCKSEDNKIWRINNPTHCKQYAHQNWLNNKEVITQYNKTYRSQNKDKQYLYSYKHRNSEKGKNNRKQYRKKEYYLKYGVDIEWTLKLTLRNRLKNAIKNNFKKGKTIELLGCSIQEVKMYLEQQFTSEMNWSNYGKDKYWEIDHIKPCDLFDLSDENEQKICFHYTNLQPLSITQNRTKSNKYE
jgi:hypothetical protein